MDKRKLAILMIVLAALISAVACGSDEPPSEATLKELALLSESGNAQAKSELVRVEATVAVDPNRNAKVNVSRAVESAKEKSPPPAVAAELARLANSGDAGAAKKMREIDQLSNRYKTEDVAARREMDAVVLLASSSAADDAESARRGDAAEELSTRFDRGELESRDALDLLDTIAPGASINARRVAAEKLAALSEVSGDWNAEQRMEAANEITRLITGHGLDAERRIEAARELATRFDSGNLEAADALDLMDTIAPGSGIKKRAQALGSIARRFGEDGGSWDADDAMGLADDLHRVAFGDDLNYEKRGRAGIDLATGTMKRFGDDSISDEDWDNSGRLIKEAMFGDSESLRNVVNDLFSD